MATTDLNQDHVKAGAEALQREDWQNNCPLICYIPTAETVLDAVAELPKRQITDPDELERIAPGSVLEGTLGRQVSAIDDGQGESHFYYAGAKTDPRQIIAEMAPLSVLFEAAA